MQVFSPKYQVPLSYDNVSCVGRVLCTHKCGDMLYEPKEMKNANESML